MVIEPDRIAERGVAELNGSTSKERRKTHSALALIDRTLEPRRILRAITSRILTKTTFSNIRRGEKFSGVRSAE